MPPTRDPMLNATFARRLAIETPEHVVVELELAGLGSRMAAAICDAAILLTLFLLLLIGSGGVSLRAAASPRWSTALGVLVAVAAFLLFWGYFLLFEGLRGGRTPGKQLLG